ncbi:2-isopropylmalate synthase [Ideonella livida]|uniref:2-isopropylmalate synthase n=1 Tax=Ideonella livida TaxID=2707176 RepID=A0A7C9TMN5_9BURK|nr:2-isopropylmalate synthase [Ideonella livida]NDY93462.1 2-isopropylmalate synthase [Ideonella livida]
MLRDPSPKYRPFPAVDLPDRQWPGRQIRQAPVWMSTDLRDGNQALFEPMNGERKLRLWQLLVSTGFKEIEAGFPAASQIDFDFVRGLIEQGHIPADVTPMVMTQAREDLIERTVLSLRGARRAIVHLYNATAPAWRELVFRLSVDEVMALIERQVGHLRRLTDAQPETEWVLQYSPETFCMTELPVSLRACETAMRAWGVGPGRPIILNLPTTVEVSTPNVFADQVEWMHRHLPQREHIILSVHPHNDRGTGVACAELAQMAGADRVEGCLFGNGERSGNVDLVTLALNLYTQGVSPRLDFSDLAGAARVVEACTGIPLHPRHPYAGDLVHTAFSGSHQDAIKKGLTAQQDGTPWRVPYLPIDPQDIGRSFDSVIRVNSQSGKGGIAYLMERHFGLVMPRRLQVEFSAVVQRHADASEAEIDVDTLWRLFAQAYLGAADTAQALPQPPQLHRSASGTQITLPLPGATVLHGHGNGPVEAAVNALGGRLRIDHFEEHAARGGADAPAWAIVEATDPLTRRTSFGVGRHADIGLAGALAVLSAAQRLQLLPADTTHRDVQPAAELATV